MRIEGWQIKAFGLLADWAEADLSRHDLVIVLGANESGKSTLFEFLTSALFGFSPARAQDHPYSPWDGRYPDGSLEVGLADGSRARVARRLTSRAEGRLDIDGTEQDLANRSVPWVGLLSRAVFTNVHALTQDEALGLDQRAWQAVQDRVLGGSSYDFLRPSREVVEDLETRRTRYWRPDQRGKPQHRQINDRIRELRRDLLPARDRRAQIEKIDAKLSAIDEKFNYQEGELHRIELALERDSVLAPLLRRVERMRDLERDATAPVASGELAADIAIQRSTLITKCADMPEKIQMLEGEVDAHERAQELNEAEVRLLENRELIERLDRTAARTEDDEDRIQRMDAHLQRSEGALRELAERTLADAGLEEDVREAILQIPIVELRRRHQEWTDKHRQAGDAEGALAEAETKRARLQRELKGGESAPKQRELNERMRELQRLQLSIASRAPASTLLPPAVMWLLGAGLLAGVIAIAVGLAVGGAPGTALTAIGVMLAVAFGIALIVPHVARRRAEPRADQGVLAEQLQRLEIDAYADLEAEIERTLAARDDALRQEGLLEQCESAEEDKKDRRERAEAGEASATKARDMFLSLVDALLLAPVHRERPDDMLVRDLESMHGVIKDAREVQRDRDRVTKRLHDWRTHVEQVRQELATELHTNPFDAVLVARRQLDEALEAQQTARQAAAEIPDLQTKLARARDELSTSEAELRKINAVLAAIDPDGSDSAEGLKRLEEARELQAEAVRVHTDLDRETPDWKKQVAEAERLVEAGETIGLGDEERVELRRQRANALSKSPELADRRGSLRTERESLMEVPGPAHIVGEIAAAEDDLTFVQREHDRLALLQQVSRLAEQRYRERYQSPLLNAAGVYLERFTAGRYDLLTVEDADPSNVKLQVRRSSAEFPEPVAPPLSRGTIQQVYFALRLAMVDQVEGEEPLPLFLDEMFVNWDPDRTASGLKALAHMAEDRQVLLFTADPMWADNAHNSVGAHIVRTPDLAS